MIFEDMVEEPAPIFEDLLRFLAIDTEYRPSFEAHNPSFEPRTQWLRTLVRSAPAQWLLWTALPRIVGDSRTRVLVRGSGQPTDSPHASSRWTRRYAFVWSTSSRRMWRDE